MKLHSKTPFFVLTLAIASALALTPVLIAQESAMYALRGTVAETYPSGLGTEALIHSGPDAYAVSCSGACDATLQTAIGQCADLWGDVLGDAVSGSYSHVYYLGDIVSVPSNCATVRSLALYVGHVASYTPSHVSASGRVEFDLSSGSNTFRIVCASMYGGCATQVLGAYYTGRCAAVNARVTVATLGFVGDMWVLNSATSIQVFNRIDC